MTSRAGDGGSGPAVDRLRGVTIPRRAASGPGPEDCGPGWRSLVGFFVLACAGSWTCWVLADVVAPSAPRLAETLDIVASYGPALAALVVSVRSIRVRAAVAGLLVPTVVAGVGRERDVHRLRGRLGWLVVALLLFPVTSVAGLVVVGALSGPVTSVPGGTAWPATPTTLLGVFTATALYGGPVGEEPGWRGFALPRLQTALSPLLASVVVGLGWAAWHLPLQLRGDYEESMGAGLRGVGLRFASQVAVSVIFTWIFNRSNGSLLAVVVLHTSLNNTAGYWLPNSLGFQVGVGVLATVLVLAEHMYRPPDPRSDLTRGRFNAPA